VCFVSNPPSFLPLSDPFKRFLSNPVSAKAKKVYFVCFFISKKIHLYYCGTHHVPDLKIPFVSST
jgi:hypothetical protein